MLPSPGKTGRAVNGISAAILQRKPSRAASLRQLFTLHSIPPLFLYNLAVCSKIKIK
jgi:hypothetical protein